MNLYDYQSEHFRVVQHYSNGYKVLIKGKWHERKEFAWESPDLMEKYARTALSLMDEKGRVGFIGAGTCVTPRLISGSNLQIDIYEIEKDIIDLAKKTYSGSDQWNFIHGDYKEKLSGFYDIIVYDLVEPIDKGILLQNLKKEGKIF